MIGTAKRATAPDSAATIAMQPAMMRSTPLGTGGSRSTRRSPQNPGRPRARPRRRRASRSSFRASDVSPPSRLRSSVDTEIAMPTDTATTRMALRTSNSSRNRGAATSARWGCRSGARPWPPSACIPPLVPGEDARSRAGLHPSRRRPAAPARAPLTREAREERHVRLT